MDIRIILNPGAVGTSQSSSMVLKKTPRQGTPTSEQSYPGSATANQLAASSRSSPASVSSARKSKSASYVKRQTSGLRQQSPASSPSTRQSRPRKRRLAQEEEEAKVEAEDSSAKWTASTKKRRSSTQSHSSSNSTSATAPSSPSLASLLLFRAKQQHARESAAGPPGSPRRSIMDVVMDMKGEGEESQADVLFLIAERFRSASERREYVLTNHEGLAAYWEDQAVIWGSSSDGGGISFSTQVLTRFPVSMERSTASATEEGEYLEV